MQLTWHNKKWCLQVLYQFEKLLYLSHADNKGKHHKLDEM